MGDKASASPLVRAITQVYNIDTAVPFSCDGNPSVLSVTEQRVVDDLKNALQILQQQTKDMALCAFVDICQKTITHIYAEVCASHAVSRLQRMSYQWLHNGSNS